MGNSILDNGIKGEEKEEGNRFGGIVKCMKVIGKETNHMAMEGRSILMLKSTQATGSMAKHMVMENSLMLMDLLIVATGYMTIRRVTVKKIGLMVHNLRGNIETDRSLVVEFLNGNMETRTEDNSTTTKLKVLANTLGRMAVLTKVTGKTTKCMDKESSHGLMEGSILVIILKTRNREKVVSSGLMVECMRVLG